MRMLTYGAACSLDGYIAGPDESLDWLRWNKDVARLSGEFMSRVDTIVMGRKTYEAGRRQGAGGQKGFENIVFSRSLTDLDDANAKVVNDDAVPFIHALKQQPGKEICLMGGGELAMALFAADLIDRVGVNIHPVILGGGVPLLPQIAKRIELRLHQLERLADDCVYAVYDVAR